MSASSAESIWNDHKSFTISIDFSANQTFEFTLMYALIHFPLTILVLETMSTPLLYQHLAEVSRYLHLSAFLSLSFFSSQNNPIDVDSRWLNELM